MTHCYLLTIIRCLLCCRLPRHPHKMCILKRSCLLRLPSLSYSTNNQPLCGPFPHSCYILCWNGVSLYSCFISPYFCFLLNQMPCDHTFHICCMCPWITFPCVDFFLQILFIEPYLLGFIFLVCCFHPTMFKELTSFLLEVLVCYLLDVDISRDSHRFIFFW